MIEMAENIVPRANKEVIPASECQTLVGVAGEIYIVHLRTGISYMNQSALAKLCETSQQTINKLCSSNTTKDYPEWLQTLLGGRSLTTTKFENPNNIKNGEPYQCLNSGDCWVVLNYAANFSRGHENRKQAKVNLAKIGEAGMTAFIYNQAGFVMNPESVVTEDLETTNGKILVGTWEEARVAAIEPRKAFATLCHELGKSHGKYSNKCYNALFACNAETLRKRRLISGTGKIARNHIEEPLEIAAVTRLEELVVQNYEPGMSLTRLIVFFGFIAIAQLNLPEPDRKRQTEYRRMLENQDSTLARLTSGGAK